MSPAAVLFLSTLAGILPTLFYAALIYWVDRYEKEPWWLLAAVFLWGAVPSILVAFVFNRVLSIPFYLLAGEDGGDALAATFIAPLVEESIKGLVLLAIFFLWRHEIDSPLDGIIYGAMVGMGFAMVENIYYFLNVYGDGGIRAWEINIFVRSIIFGLNHALFSSMTGLGIALARMSARRFTQIFAPLAGWFLAMFLHFLHNFSLAFDNLLCFVALITDWGGVWLTGVIILWALLQERQWIKKYLAEEVGQGALTRQQYEIACSSRQRARHGFNLLLSQGPRASLQAARFYYCCSELAYKKHHFSLFQDEKSGQLIEKIRGEVVELGRFAG